MNGRYTIRSYGRSFGGFLFLLLAIFYSFYSVATADVLILADGEKIDVESVWKEDGRVCYQKFDCVVCLDKSRVSRIIKGKNKTVKKARPAPASDKDSETLLFNLHEKTITLKDQIAELEAAQARQQAILQQIVDDADQKRAQSDFTMDSSNRQQQWQGEFLEERSKLEKINTDLMVLKNQLFLWERQFHEDITRGRSEGNDINNLSPDKAKSSLTH